MKRWGTIACMMAAFTAGVVFVYACNGGGSASAGGVRIGHLTIGLEGFHADDPMDSSYDSLALMHLPDGARILSITGHFTDAFRPGTTSLSFQVFGLDGVEISSEYLNTGGLDGYGTVTLDYPDGLVVDNTLYYYCFRWPNPTAAIYFHSVVVEYEYAL